MGLVLLFLMEIWKMAYTERQQHMNAVSGKVLRGGHGVGDFGVEPFEAMNGGGPDMGPCMTGVLSDGDRGVGEPVSRGKGQMPAQRHPDHGPHGHHEPHERRHKA